MKGLITILLFAFALATYSQPAEPILRIETGMHTGFSTGVSIDNSSKTILSSSGKDKTARLWDSQNGALLNIFRIPIYFGFDGDITSCALSPDGKISALSVAYFAGTAFRFCIYIFDSQTGGVKSHFNIPTRVLKMEFSPNGRFLATSHYSGENSVNGIKVYRTDTWQIFKEVEGKSAFFYDFAYSLQNKFAIAENEKRIRLYDENYNLIAEQTTSSILNYLSFSKKGDWLAVIYGYPDVAVELRSTNDISIIKKLPFNTYNGWFSADGKNLYSQAVNNNKTVKCNYFSILNLEDFSSKDIELNFNGCVFTNLKVLANSSILIQTNREIQLRSSGGEIIWSNSMMNLDLINDDQSHLKVNSGGNIVGFTPVGSSAFTFNITERKLENKQCEYPSFTDKNVLNVSCWDSRICGQGPEINNKRTDFLEENDASVSVDISNDGNTVVFGGRDFLYKADNQSNLIWKVPLPESAYGGINISSNNKTIVAALFDGTIRWYRMSDGKELLACFFHSDQKRWVLFTPSGYYDASPGAEELLGWHLNNGPDNAPSFYPVSRFKEKFYRPDIIDAIFETYSEDDAITLANQRSSKKIITANTDIRQKLPPTITINSPANGSNISSNTVSISYVINSPDDAPAKNLRVLIDGRPVATERGLKPTASASQKITVTVPSQDCTITLLAENDNGTSPETNLYLKWVAPVAIKEEFIYKPKLYVLAIGVSDYNNPELKLGFAAKDAGDFAGAINKQKGNLYSDVIVKKLTNKEATKDAMIDGLEWIQKQTGQKDVAMIFYAGHGINDNNGVFYMLPVAADLERIRATCLNFEELKQTVSSIAGKVVVFIDACHSGNVMGSTKRGGNDINAVVNELSSTENGAITFTSSTGKEFSLEDLAWGNGAFTKAVIEGLNGKAVINGKNKITVKSLDAYISERVKELTKGKQHPTSVSPPNVPDFPIAVTQ